MSNKISSLLPIKSTDTVILDTDICTDCDDCGALSVLVCGCKHTGARLGAVINNVDGMYGCGAIDAILSFYGVSAPIGITSDKGFLADAQSRYSQTLSEQFSENFQKGTLAVRPALEVYREVLQNADDQSVVLITVGFLNTAAEILAAEPGLFADKVRCVVSMAGNFENLSYREYNIATQVPAAQAFFHICPVPVFYHGFEVGVSIKTGFAELIPDNPVSVAYQLHSGGYNCSFDPAAVDFAFRGECADWTVSDPVLVQVKEDGSLSVNFEADSLQAYVKFADQEAKERVRMRLDGIYSDQIFGD